MASPPLVSMQKMKLSASTDGRPVKVAATAIGSGTTIHTATSNANGVDLVTLYASNTDTVARKLTIGWGGVTDPDDLIEVTIPPESGLVQITDRLPIANSLIVKAAAFTANVVLLTGFVDRLIYSA